MNDDMTILLDQFQYVLAGHAVSKDTKSQYLADVRSFLNGLTDLNEDDIPALAKDYIAKLAEAEAGEGTIRRKKSAINLLVKECFASEVDWDVAERAPYVREASLPVLLVPHPDWSWADNAACKEQPKALFFKKKYIDKAKAICAACPVAEQCRDFAIENKLEGVWGGLTDEERKDHERSTASA